MCPATHLEHTTLQCGAVDLVQVQEATQQCISLLCLAVQVRARVVFDFVRSSARIYLPGPSRGS